jgi:hypothetical protein
MAAVNHREFASHGLVHPSFFHPAVGQTQTQANRNFVPGKEIDFYSPAEGGDKKSGIVHEHVHGKHLKVKEHGTGTIHTLKYADKLPDSQHSESFQFSEGESRLADTGHVSPPVLMRPEVSSTKPASDQ